MFVRAAALDIDEGQRRQLESLLRAGATPQKNVRRCRVILLASQGVANHSIAQQTGLSRPTVLATRAAFAKRGIAGICEPQRRKRSSRILTPELEQRILDTTLKTRPAGATQLERPGAGGQAGCFSNDGAACLATLRCSAAPRGEIQNLQ